MKGESRMDALARDLASGRISRRTAVKRALGGAVAVAVPSALLADPALAKCPKSRTCGKKCCPKGMKCKKGKCKCKGGLKKCGKKCFDVSTDPANCGSCGQACAPGQTCSGGQCTGGGDGGDGGGGGDGGVQTATCGNGVKEAGEICDGTDLGGATCQSLGFVSGTLVCASNCTLDTSGCVSPQCSTAADCPQGPAGDCQKAVCTGGTCGFVADDTDSPADDGNLCTNDTCVNGVPSHPPVANGLPCAGLGTCQGGVCLDPCTPNPCNTPPPPICAANVLTTFFSPGICTPAGAGFLCTYTPIPMFCPTSCAGGVCI